RNRVARARAAPGPNAADWPTRARRTAAERSSSGCRRTTAAASIRERTAPASRDGGARSRRRARRAAWRRRRLRHVRPGSPTACDRLLQRANHRVALAAIEIDRHAAIAIEPARLFVRADQRRRGADVDATQLA